MRKKVFAGFDGSIDRNVKPIRTKGTPNIYFHTIGEFGNYLAGKSGLSCSVQSDVVWTRSGGNAPYVAQTLNALGYEVHLTGMLGIPRIAQVFEPLSDEGIYLYTFADPANSDCYEFADGKIIMAPQISDVPEPFELVKKWIPQISELMGDCDLVAMLNWGEIAWMQKLWNCALDEFSEPKNLDKYFFFDLADISCRKESEIVALLNLLKKATEKRYTILSLNENELMTLGNVLGEAKVNQEKILWMLVNEQIVDEAVMHTVYKAVACDGKTLETVPTRHVKHPLISTGAGDNFNGGYCAAVLEGLSLKERLIQANHTSYTYITTGHPAKELANKY